MKIEAIVLGNLKPVVQVPEVVAKVAEQTGLNPKDVLSMFKGDFWRELLPEEKKRLMQILVKHVTIDEDGIEMEFYTESIKSILKTCPTPFQIECTLCYTLSRLVVRHDKAMAFCPNCGCWFEPYEEQLKWWTPCFEPVLRFKP